MAGASVSGPANPTPLEARIADLIRAAGPIDIAAS